MNPVAWIVFMTAFLLAAEPMWPAFALERAIDRETRFDPAGNVMSADFLRHVDAEGPGFLTVKDRGDDRFRRGDRKEFDRHRGVDRFDRRDKFFRHDRDRKHFPPYRFRYYYPPAPYFPPRIYPDYYNDYINRGLDLSARGYRDLAISEFTQAINSNPEFGLAYYHRSRVWNQMGRSHAAIDDARKASSLEPSNSLYRDWYYRLTSR